MILGKCAHTEEKRKGAKTSEYMAAMFAIEFGQFIMQKNASSFELSLLAIL